MVPLWVKKKTYRCGFQYKFKKKEKQQMKYKETTFKEFY